MKFTIPIVINAVAAWPASPIVQRFDRSIECMKAGVMNQRDRFEYQPAPTALGPLILAGLVVAALVVLICL